MSTITKENAIKKAVKHDYHFYNKLEENYKNNVIRKYLRLMTGKDNCYDNLEPLNRIVDKKSLNALAESFPIMSDKDNKHFASVMLDSMNYNFKSNSYVCSIKVNKAAVVNRETDVNLTSCNTILKGSCCHNEKDNVLELIDDLCSELRSALIDAMDNDR